MPRGMVHFVDLARVKDELRPLCGAWHEDVTWTTLRTAMTCPACVRLLRAAGREGRPEDGGLGTSLPKVFGTGS
jgi:hypothetical protein